VIIVASGSILLHSRKLECRKLVGQCVAVLYVFQNLLELTGDGNNALVLVCSYHVAGPLGTLADKWR
jgi:hypothetical protein